MPVAIISFDGVDCDLHRVSGHVISDDLTGDYFWSITDSATTPNHADILSGVGALASGTFPKSLDARQFFSGLANLETVKAPTTRYMHVYQTTIEGDSIAVTQSFAQEQTIEATDLVVSVGAGGLNLSCNFTADVSLGNGVFKFYVIISPSSLMTNLYGDGIRAGADDSYGPALYFSQEFYPAGGTSLTLTDFDQANVLAVLGDGETYTASISFSDARGDTYFGLPHHPTLTQEFVVNLAASSATVDSVNAGSPILDGATAIPFTYSNFSTEPTSARFLDSFGGTHTLSNYIASVGVGAFDGPDVVAIINSVSANGVGFTAPNNQLTLELTNGADTATIPIIYNPAAGYAVTEHAAPVRTDLGSWFNGFTGTVLDFDQTYYPTAGNYVVSPDGEHEHDLPSGSIVDGASYDQDVNQWLKHSPQIVAQGALQITGTLSASLDGVSLASVGTIGGVVLGTLAVSLENISVSVEASTLVQGTMVIDLDDTNSQAQASTLVQGTMAITLANTTPQIQASAIEQIVQQITGTLSLQLQSNRVSILGFTDAIQSQLLEVVEQLHIWLPENNRLTAPQMSVLVRPILLSVGIGLTFRPEVTYKCLEAVARLNKSKAITSYGLSKEKVDRVEYHYSNSGKTPADLWDEYLRGLPEIGALIGYRKPSSIGIRVSPGVPINTPTSWRARSLF